MYMTARRKKKEFARFFVLFLENLTEREHSRGQTWGRNSSGCGLRNKQKQPRTLLITLNLLSRQLTKPNIFHMSFQEPVTRREMGLRFIFLLHLVKTTCTKNLREFFFWENRIPNLLDRTTFEQFRYLTFTKELRLSRSLPCLQPTGDQRLYPDKRLHSGIWTWIFGSNVSRDSCSTFSDGGGGLSNSGTN